MIVLVCCRNSTSAVGFRFCGMMLLVPVTSPPDRTSHGLVCVYCAAMSSASMPIVKALVDARAAASTPVSSGAI